MATSNKHHDGFKNHMKKHGVKHSHWDDKKLVKRYELFAKNADFISKHNSNRKRTYKLRQNAFSHMTPDELKQLLPSQLPIRPTARALPAKAVTKPPPPVDPTLNIIPPATLDYTSFASPIRDQGICGSCSDFGTTGMIELNYRIKYNNTWNNTLSTQQLVDCTPINKGCKGGWPIYNFKYIQSKNYTMASESSYPYTSGKRVVKPKVVVVANATTTAAPITTAAPVCKTVAPSSLVSLPMTKFGEDVMNGNLTRATQFLSYYGPVAVAMFAPSCNDFMFYSSGIYVDNCGCVSNNCTQINHVVVNVGYGTNVTTGQNYWIFRNSWGTKWGENGYFRIQRDATNMCNTMCYYTYMQI